jgi:molecular chaperone DnaK (HSP70)
MKGFTMSDIPKRIYGIDLGTTYSAIAFIDVYGKAQIITNSENDRVTPSVVFFESSENIIVGKTAKESAKTGEHEVKDVVITCPAYFGDLERERTRTAGELAGLNVIEILDEPVAAAINYGLNAASKGKNVIVYDLGGGTFDVTVVSIGNDPDKNEISIVCTEGNHQLGGKDWDDRIVQHYVAEFQSQTGSSADILSDPETAYDLRFNAETDKKTLTTKENIKRKVAFDGEKAIVELSRDKFDELTVDLTEQTLALTDKVIEQAKEKELARLTRSYS